MAKLQFTESASADAVLILTHAEARGLAQMAGEGAAARIAAGLARPNAATQRALEALGASFGMPPGVLFQASPVAQWQPPEPGCVSEAEADAHNARRC